MGKIFCVMGKSATGKDTIYQEILKQNELKLKKIIPYTTRPIRDGEVDGENYFFCNENKVEMLEKQNKIIELRAYNTVYGVWKYFTADDGQINLDSGNYILIGTLETYVKIRDYFGRDKVIPIYIEVEDGDRLIRATGREKQQEVPKYEEMCRRFIADSADFSEEKLKAAQIEKRFENTTLIEVVDEITRYIKGEIDGCQD